MQTIQHFNIMKLKNTLKSLHYHVSGVHKKFYSVSKFVDDDLLGLSDEQQMFRKNISEFAKNEIAPISEALEANETMDIKPLWKKFGEMGLLGLTAPSRYGGIEQGFLEQCIAVEEVARVSGSVAMSYGTHSNLCVNQLVRHANEQQAMRYLPKLISGEHVGGLAMSEVEAGSDVVSMKTEAIRDGDYFVLNGSKFWITNGPDADIIIVYAKTNPKAVNPQHGISAFIVETNTPGFSVGRIIKKLGMHGSHTSELIFDQCKIPATNLLGELNKGVYILMSGLDIERLVLASNPLGLMQTACDVAFDYAQVRKTFGKQICEHQMIQAKMAEMFTKTQTSRSYLYTMAKYIDQLKVTNPNMIGKKNGSINMNCAGVILHIAEAATQVALDAIQILGGAGYTTDYPVGRILRDAKIWEIGAGTTEIRKMIIARSINSLYT